MSKKKKKPVPVKPEPAFKMSPANDGIFESGDGLNGLRTVQHDDKEEQPGAPFFDSEDGPIGVQNACWLDPYLFERFCEGGPIQQEIAFALRQKGTPAAMKRLQKHVLEVFETKYLPVIINRFDEALPLLLEYLVGKEAYRRANPETVTSQ